MQPLPSVDALTRRIRTEFANLLEAEFPRFSTAEMTSRRQRIADLCAAHELDAVIVAQAMRGGTTTYWLTGWPVTQEAVTLVVPGRPQRLFIQHYNHVPLARRLAVETEVEWGEASGLGRALAALDTMLPGRPRIGLIGSLGLGQHDRLRAAASRLVDLNAAYGKLRLIKTAEELHWFRLGAALTDLGIAGLAEGARPGLSERDLGLLVEAPYQPFGAINSIHYFLTTPMAAPAVPVPMQFPSTRRLQKGDVLVTEISAQFWDHAGQVLRTFTLGEEPNALYRELHAVSEAAFDAIVRLVKPGVRAGDLVAASAVIEAAGHTIIDDLIHGYGGGYLAPVLGTASRPAAGWDPDFKLDAGMMIVVQPNVITRDNRAGVQNGHLLLVTETGAEPMQHFPAGLHVLPV
ncbi:M24 family metallopeptidase [Phreatobacter stygius]|uniref:Aminopeptidase P family protein n=1 Tax=Phreatobacter stygius TaxID=1940610 RepID=A0A4D7B4D8_9HYPH|nr:M24 family metallopeptidase [Phreatobacter stygius]QCI64546.1 aminopeptidase P family protein [Phreatobacter stygius]